MGSTRCSPRRSTGGAQLAHDLQAPGVPVLFTWASRGQATAYVYDLNSATAARDGLEHTLRLLLRSNAEKVNVLAHSMGNWVTVEAFRQIRISGDLRPPTRSGRSCSPRPISTSTCSNRSCAASASRKSLSMSCSPGRSSALSLQNHRGRRHAGGRQQRHCGAHGAGGDRHRSDRREGDRRHEPRQIRPARLRRAPAARHSRPGRAV